MRSITVAKALRLAKTLKGEVATLDARLGSCVSWSGDDTPEFAFADVRSERAEKVGRLVALKTAVARANARAEVTVGGQTLSVAGAILRLQETKGELVLIERLTLQRGTKSQHTGEFDERTMRPLSVQVTWHSALTEVQRAADVTALKARCEALNEALEESNHRVTVEVDLP